MRLALLDVRVQVIERFHVSGSKARDLGETRDFSPGQSNVVSEADHRRECQQLVASTIFALFYPVVSTSTPCFIHIFPPSFPVTLQCHYADTDKRTSHGVRQCRNSTGRCALCRITEAAPRHRIDIDRAAALGSEVDQHAMLREPSLGKQFI
jgi:hypothetical protein